ncbi:DUF2218 domain-containing protein [Halomonas sp. BM-2019]|uniref:DUF2218 domain-containing protein n=1 Tax=Halomonas sp. BM-2019 TaxID=2811227 RepID=UPI001B3C314A|nr:MAG: DUF2218 domain-containing protein [Halomonas sp. BM-2019]
MPISRAEIATESGEKLIRRLCKHWAHKLEVAYQEGEGRVTFEGGTCLMQVEEGKLVVAIEALDEEGLDRLEGVVASHLERMAGDEVLEIIWEN